MVSSKPDRKLPVRDLHFEFTSQILSQDEFYELEELF